MQALAEITKILQEYGPWGVSSLALLALAWKDRQLTKLYDRTIEIVEKQAVVNEGTKSALVGLKELIHSMNSR